MNMMTALSLLVSLALSGFVFYQNGQLANDVHDLTLKIQDIHERAFTAQVGTSPGETVNIHSEGSAPTRIFVPSTLFCSERHPDHPEEQSVIRFDQNGGVEVWGLRDGIADISNPPDARGTYTIAGMYIFASLRTGDGMTLNRRVDIEYYTEEGEITTFRSADLVYSPVFCD